MPRGHILVVECDVIGRAPRRRDSRVIRRNLKTLSMKGQAARRSPTAGGIFSRREGGRNDPAAMARPGGGRQVARNSNLTRRSFLTSRRIKNVFPTAQDAEAPQS